MATFVLCLSDAQATLENVGGKGMSLARLARAGLPVPDGFHLTTEAYRQFVAQNGLGERIQAALQGVDPGDMAALEAASSQIGALFSESKIPPEIADAIILAYGAFKETPVAVRSSATAEDLPGASFAGQQDTYLNICGTASVLQSVKRCWASLWTARAMAYRARQGIAPDGVALAVVVQKLVPADAAGVMFTANPVNGRRTEVMITATWGLGEAIVSGAVTPDTLVIDKASGRLLRRETSDKQMMTVRTASGTMDCPVPPAMRRKAVLRAVQAMRLAKLGMQIEQLYGTQMDIEWTLAGGEFAIVQARPVTSALETPLAWVCPFPQALMTRGSFAEFLPDPVSPLFATLAVPIAREASLRLMRDMMGMTAGDSYLLAVINGYVYIGIKMTWKYMFPMIKASFTQAKKLLANSTERWLASRAVYKQVVEKWSQRDLGVLATSALLDGAREIFTATAEYFTVVQASVIPAASSSEVSFSRFYDSLVKRPGDPNPGMFLVGLDNQALRAEKALYDLASWIQAQPELAQAMRAEPAEQTVERLQAPADGGAWDAVRARFEAYLGEFGHAAYDMDFAKPLPADQPAPLVEALKMYLGGGGSNPYARQQAMAERNAQAEQAIARRLDPLRRKGFLKLLKWAQNSAPYREDGIAGLGLGYPQLRRMLAELGRRLAACGAIEAASDIYWLEVAEVEVLASVLERGETPENHAGQVTLRKARWQILRRATPPMSVPEKAWLTGLLIHENPQGSRTLKGYAASAGVVTAPACVMLGPEDFGRMRPGDVIVAVTTTPAWTPLFALASGVVTDIGGPLSHSSIVAREYGIPAVMATSSASRLIQSGQSITVDGGKGIVTINT
jgi:rifampicin phosphotransferase